MSNYQNTTTIVMLFCFLLVTVYVKGVVVEAVQYKQPPNLLYNPRIPMRY